MAQCPLEFSLSIVFSVANQSGSSELITICSYDSHPRTHQYDIILAFELPTMSVMSEENGTCVNMVY